MTVPSRLARDMEAAVRQEQNRDPVAAALKLLRLAEGRPDRAAAYQLLAADGLLTQACAEAVTAPDAERVLDDVLDRTLEALG